METKQKSLQKFTESKIKIDNLLSSGRQITIDGIKGLKLNDKGIGYLIDVLHKNLNKLEGVERDNFINNVYDLIDDNTKNQLWESNHNQITYAISTLIHELNRMPSKNEIAHKSELSRQTVHKHLSEYSKHPIYMEQIEQFRFLTSKVLAKVFHFAVNGDMGAAKLYFNVMGYLNGQLSNNTLIQNQNNYIQINGIVLSQETVKKLNPEQLYTIETILKTALPKAEDLAVKITKVETV
jgi:hypothetical protein